MPLPALLVVALGAAPNPALSFGLELTLAQEENGPPEGSAPPPVVESPLPPPPEPPQPLPPGQSGRAFAPNEPLPAPGSWGRPPLPPPPLADVGTRVLFGVGLHTGGGVDQFSVSPGRFSSQSSTSGIGIGVYARLGLQIDDPFGVDGELSAATLLLTDYVRGALTFDVTPVDWLTVAIGPVVREDVAANFCTSGSTTAQAVGATARLEFHFGVRRGETGRSAFALGVAGDLGATIGSDNGSGASLGGPGLAYGLYLTTGWAHF
ncbi:MAG: hypothetical protein ACYDCL_12340 [Myxococcales bacterium]